MRHSCAGSAVECLSRWGLQTIPVACGPDVAQRGSGPICGIKAICGLQGPSASTGHDQTRRAGGISRAEAGLSRSARVSHRPRCSPGSIKHSPRWQAVGERNGSVPRSVGISPKRPSSTGCIGGRAFAGCREWACVLAASRCWDALGWGLAQQPDRVGTSDQDASRIHHVHPHERRSGGVDHDRLHPC
jgi:hypothetical protein